MVSVWVDVSMLKFDVGLLNAFVCLAIYLWDVVSVILLFICFRFILFCVVIDCFLGV